MTALPVRPTLTPRLAVGEFFLATVAALVIALAVSVLEFAAISLAVVLATFVLAAVYPRAMAIVTLMLLMALEPNAPDATSVIAEPFYNFPWQIQAMLPLTIAPAEILILLIAGSIGIRQATALDGRRPPWIVWPAFGALMLGLAVGLSRGADHGIAYHELRGLLFGSIIFFIAWRMRDTDPKVALRVVVASGVVLATLLLLRYAFVTREDFEGTLVGFAHESVIFLNISLVVVVGQIFKARTLKSTLFLVLLATLLIVATAATGRRAGTLVLLMVAATTVALILPKRPVMISMLTAVGLVFIAGYLAAYWNSDYGAVSQPARAVRSQFDPNERDLSSNLYREIERYNVIQTIRSTPVLGVGFGQPFYEFVPLVQTFGGQIWPLQLYTPHDSLLWLWLKVGLGGMATLLTLWLLALRRCVSHIRLHPPRSVPLVPLTIAATLVAYLAFARIDLAFLSTRTIAPLAVAIAIAFALADTPEEFEESNRRLAGGGS